MHNLIEIFVDKHLRVSNFFKRLGDKDEIVKIGVCLISLYMWIFQILFCFQVGIYIDSLICALTTLGITTCLFLLKSTRIKVDTLFNFVAFFTVLGLLAVNVNAGMGVNPSMMFFCAVPLFVIPICGFKAGLIWSSISIFVSVLCMHLAQTLNFTWNEFNSVQWYQVGISNLFSGPVLFLGIFGYYYMTSTRLSRENLLKKKQIEGYLMENEKLVRILTHDIARNVALLSSNLEMSLSKNKFIENHEKLFIYINNIKEILLNSPEASRGVVQDKKSIDIDEIISELLGSFRQKIEAKNIKINYVKEDNFEPKVNVEQFKIHILGNILSNAIKYSNDCSSVEILCAQNRIKVINDGTPFDSKGEHFESGAGFGIPIIKEFSKVNGLKFDIVSKGAITEAVLFP